MYCPDSLPDMTLQKEFENEESGSNSPVLLGKKNLCRHLCKPNLKSPRTLACKQCIELVKT